MEELPAEPFHSRCFSPWHLSPGCRKLMAPEDARCLGWETAHDQQPAPSTAVPLLCPFHSCPAPGGVSVRLGTAQKCCKPPLGHPSMHGKGWQPGEAGESLGNGDPIVGQPQARPKITIQCSSLPQSPAWTEGPMALGSAPSSSLSSQPRIPVADEAQPLQRWRPAAVSAAACCFCGALLLSWARGAERGEPRPAGKRQGGRARRRVGG